MYDLTQSSWLAIYVGLWLQFGQGAAPVPAPPLRVSLEVKTVAVFATEKEDKLIVLVTLRNPNAQVTFTNVTVTLAPGSTTSNPIDHLHPGQTQVLCFSAVTVKPT